MRWILWAVLAGCTGPTVTETDPTGSTDDTDETDTGSPPVDVDQDGYDATEDCNDLDPRINPGADEIPWNEVDDDCDGVKDADGRVAGQADVTFRATVEGTPYRWDLQCPVVVDRSGWQFTFAVTCTPPEGDDLARLVMGETMTVKEVDNIADDANFAGAITVVSTDGWKADGTGKLTWTDLDTVAGEVSMRARFASLAGTFTARR